jgi:hypothetical protein
MDLTKLSEDALEAVISDRKDLMTENIGQPGFVNAAARFKEGVDELIRRSDALAKRLGVLR